MINVTKLSHMVKNEKIFVNILDSAFSIDVFVFMIFMSRPFIRHLGQKIGHWLKQRKSLGNALDAMYISLSSCILFDALKDEFKCESSRVPNESKQYLFTLQRIHCPFIYSEFSHNICVKNLGQD